LKKKKKYETVYDYLRIVIDQNKFSSASKLPSEAFLSKKFSVCRSTVRLAIEKLEAEGLVETRRGSGTYADKAKALSVQGEKGEHRYRIALILQGQDRSASRGVLVSLKAELARRDADLFIFYTDNRHSNERRCLESCKTGFDGLVVDAVKASMANPNLDVYSSLQAKGVPFIFYNNFYAGTIAPRIISDDEGSADKLVEALAEKGHRNIAGIFFYDNYQGTMKYQGYVKALLKRSLPFDDRNVKFLISDNIEKDEYFERTLWNFLRTIPRCTAILCCNIMIYQTLKRVLEKHSLSCPENYSLVCFDYSRDELEKENITCSIYPEYEVGKLAGERIIEMAEGKVLSESESTMLIKPVIHYGNSVKDLRLSNG
jgi:Transcriptional regulators